MQNKPQVDVVVNIFAKPYQTALSVLSLLQFSGKHVDRVYLQFEPSGSEFDATPPYAIAAYLADKAVVSQPKYWLKMDPTDPERLDDPEYRFSIRYQHAFETTDKPYLFVMHNDVFIKRDIIGAMRERIGTGFAIGSVGQCWNCPARSAELVESAGLGTQPCTPDGYREFGIDADGLKRLYDLAGEYGVFVRPYAEGLYQHYGKEAWPLPECRVNEWGCLVDIPQTRQHVFPSGPVLPFGAFEPCGPFCLDTATAWFRDLNRKGLRAEHMDLNPYLIHWVGTGKMTKRKYTMAEEHAKSILEKGFQPFVTWCRQMKNEMF